MILRTLQHFFIFNLNLINIGTGRISEKAKDRIILFLYIALFSFFIAFRATIFKGWAFRELLPTKSSRYLFCTIIFLVITILSIKKPLHRVRWRSSVILAQLTMGLLIIIISFIHPIGDGYRLFGVQLILVFPAFFLVWNNRRDYENLFCPIINAMLFVGMLFYIINYILAFGGNLATVGTRCNGCMPNANSFSLIGMEMVLGGLYLFSVKDRRWIKSIYSGVSIGMGTGIILTGQMRVAFITVFICIMTSLFFNFRYFKVKIDRTVLCQLLIIILLIFLFVEASSAMMDINKRARERNQGITPSVETTESQNKAPQEPDVGDRFDISTGKDLNTYSSGRIQIWKNYASHLNWIGNDFDQYDPVKFTGSAELPYAHNIFLEIAYRCGVPVGILSMIYYLICGFICIGFLFFKTDNKQRYLLFPIIASIAFALEALLDCAVLPFFQAEALVFYISVAVIVDKKINIKQTKSAVQDSIPIRDNLDGFNCTNERVSENMNPSSGTNRDGQKTGSCVDILPPPDGKYSR